MGYCVRWLALSMVCLTLSCGEEPPGPETELEAVRVSIVTPTDRSFVSGQVMVVATAAPLEALERIDFSLIHDDREVMSRHVDGPLCEFLLDTSPLEDGVHRLEARALFTGQDIVEASATIIVDNTPPELVLVSPQPGESVFIEDASTSFVVSALDLSSVDDLTMTVNGEPVTTVTSDGDNTYRVDVDFDELNDDSSEDLATPFELDLAAEAVDALGHRSAVSVTLGVSSRQRWQTSVPCDSSGISGLATSPDGELLYVATGLGTLHVRSAETGEEICQFDAGAEMYRAPTVSPDGTAVYVGTQSGLRAISTEPQCTALWTVGDGEIAQGRPTVDAATGTIFVTTRSDGGQGGLYAVSPSGQLLWSRAVPGLLRSGPTLVPAIDGVVVTSDDGSVYAVSLANPQGDFIWVGETGGELEASATYADGVVYVGSNDFSVYAFDASSGDRVWDAPFPTGRTVTTSPSVDAEGFVYVTSRDMRLYRLSPLRRLDWSYESVGGIVYSNPVVADEVDLVFFGDAGLTAADGFKYGVIHAVSLGSGERVWSAELEGAITVSPVIFGDVVYAGTEAGQIYAFYLTPEDAYAASGDGDGEGNPDDAETDTGEDGSDTGEGDEDDTPVVSCADAGGFCWPRECRSDFEFEITDASCASALESCCGLRW